MHVSDKPWLTPNYKNLIAKRQKIERIYSTITGPYYLEKGGCDSDSKGKCLCDINTDLRPISLTPSMAKICERFLADWLMKSIIDQIDERQYGSQKRSSTTHALLSFINYLVNRSDEPKNVIRILLDFTKAFDHIGHNTLLSPLSVPQTILHERPTNHN